MCSKSVLALMAAGVLCLAATGLQAEILQFDFGPAAVAPTDGFVRVSEDTVYSTELGYGIFHHNTSVTPSPYSRDRGSVSPYSELATFASMGDGQRFQVDVPNDDYYVTVVAGDPSYTYWERLAVNGTHYTFHHEEGHAPAGAPLYLMQHTGFTTDLEVIDMPQSAWRSMGSPPYTQTRILGYNTSGHTDEDNKNIEYLFPDKLSVTVTDGMITVENVWGGSGNKLNYVVIEPVPEPASLGLVLTGAGVILFRRRRSG